jgi:hypothetical protein
MCQSLSLFFMARTVLIDAVPGLLQVWSLVRSFDQPQRYKPFVSRCVLRGGDLEIGSVREVNVKTGLPATTSTERLEQLDDDEHILSVKFVGGDHRLRVRAIASRFVLYFLLTKCFISSLMLAWPDILASGYNIWMQ